VNIAIGATVLPYTRLVGQQQLKTALELSYIAPRIGGVLVSGERGTAKSTAVRAFALMVYGELPVTLPINATDDRVLGGWQIAGITTINSGQPIPRISESTNGFLRGGRVRHGGQLACGRAPAGHSPTARPIA